MVRPISSLRLTVTQAGGLSSAHPTLGLANCGKFCVAGTEDRDKPPQVCAPAGTAQDDTPSLLCWLLVSM